MPGRGPLARPCAIVYQYDGSLPGLYACVHRSVYDRQLPLDIQADAGPGQCQPPGLLPALWIETDRDKARRVREAVAQKIAPRARELVETVFLSCLAQREIHILRFLLLGFEQGAKALGMSQHPHVSVLLGAESHLRREAHLYLGFVRFSDQGYGLVSSIRPKNFVLPFIADHFMNRFPNERFMIYDKTHDAALVYENGQGRILRPTGEEKLSPTLPLERGTSPPAPGAETASGAEALYQQLWKRFYQTIAIQARINPKCRKTHIPLRYWSEMTEMREEAEKERGSRAAEAPVPLPEKTGENR